MALANTTQSYGGLAKVFHWLVALLIITAIPTGLVANGLPVDAANLPMKAQLFSIHKTLGIAAFAVAALRILWAVSQPKPGLLNADRKLESFAAETAHWLLYASLVIVPLSGWIHHAATTGFAPILWPLGQDLPLVPKSEAVAGFFASCHYVFTKVLGITLLLHILGALKHHVIDKDATLRRMWFGRTEIAGLMPHASARAPIVTAGVIYLAALGGATALAATKDHTTPTVAEVAAPQTASDAAPGNWVVSDGTLGISVQNFGSAVSGSFGSWDAQITFDEAATGDIKGSVDVTIAVGSLTLGSVTSNALGGEFLNAEVNTTATYQGDILADGDGYVIPGILALNGVEAEVPLTFTLVVDGDTATANGTARIDRQTFNVGETYPDESTVGFGVDVAISLTATRLE
ncbi:MAG: cytochrome b/b6 domain-containing protein [Pseudomonadota bacterium]